MTKTKPFSKTGRARITLGALLLASVTGCVGYVDGPRGEIDVGPPVFVAQDDYVYYPSYGVYYSSSRREYAYQEGGAWVARSAPRGVTVNVLLASPSVRMDFHDSPANHQAEMVQRYPRNWKAPGPGKSQKENRKDDKRDGHRDENGR
jgi:hypothetical protein